MIRERLVSRADARGLSTEDPDLHVIIRGRRIDPYVSAAGHYRFALGIDPGDVHLRSRSGIPREIKPVHHDERRLGIALGQLSLIGDGWAMPIDLQHPLLSAGFHPAEEGFRWTDGDALLPLRALIVATGSITLDLVVEHRMIYFTSIDRTAADPRDVIQYPAMLQSTG